ncbi:glycoside hydrolase family 3 protein [Streptomyces sp. NBC_01498]|uniref:glycoside hydrolase family 3 N-terminal domain-containing protein n=1 Tax=Streptomyces sp. NBC_01498 TaxID=2975870 RepID=UPI002E7B382F|nr:glycoside hydrolase family 3 N-terminal domain-containing protein [Streptomyces sp. NBC_01498]WTL26338.1 glycoside hydrolase family 3 protein [Streptomyces sp. NBC_01498]
MSPAGRGTSRGTSGAGSGAGGDIGSGARGGTGSAASADAEALRLVNAVLLPGFHGTEPPAWLLDAVDNGLAGVVYFAHNVPDPETAAALSAGLHARRADLIVASDEEGGDVTRLEAATGSSYPGNGALGRVDDTGITERIARAIGHDLRAAGIGLNLAPDADVNADPDNPVIGIRAFGADPALVARHSAAYVTGLQSAGVAACAKHFPGHGDTAVDSHLGLPHLDADLDLLRRRDLPPFRAAVEAGSRCLMTGHLTARPFGPAPASLNAEAARLAREELGFTGAIVTDALDMGAVVAEPGYGPACVQALLGGADLLCLGNPADADAAARAYTTARDALLGALADGVLPVDRLADAGHRARELADWIVRGRATPSPPKEDALPLAVARAALRVRGNVALGPAPYVIDLRQRVNHASGSRAPHLIRLLTEALPGLTVTGVPPEGPTGARADHALGGGAALGGGLARTGADGAAGAGAEGSAGAGSAGAGARAAGDGAGAGAADGRPLVLIAREPHRDAAETALLRELVTRRPDAVVLLTGWPHAVDALAAHTVVTYGSARVNAQAAVERLLGGTPHGG